MIDNLGMRKLILVFVLSTFVFAEHQWHDLFANPKRTQETSIVTTHPKAKSSKSMESAKLPLSTHGKNQWYNLLNTHVATQHIAAGKTTSSAVSQIAPKKQGIVTRLDPNGDGFLSLRTKPKGREIGKLYNGDKVDILASRGKWYKVKTVSAGQIGWAHGNWIKIVDDKKKIDEKIYDLLFKSIKNNDISALNKLLNNANLDIDYNDKKLSTSKISRGTPLYYAIKLGYIDLAKILINHNADINKDMIIYSKSYSGKDIYKSSYTPLAWALQDDLNISTVKNIIKLGADVTKNIQNERKESPLYLLGKYKYIDANIVRTFLEHGARIDYGDYADITPLASLISNIVDKNVYPIRFKKQYEAIKILLQNGANPNKKAYTVGGYTPMTYAASTTLSIVKLLKSYGGKLDFVADNGDTMLHKVENLSVINYLLDNGLKKYINYKNKDGETPIISIFSNITDGKSKEITKTLLDSGAILPKKNNLLNKINFWMIDDNYAGEYEESLRDAEYKIDYAKLLLAHGADINQKDDEGRTILDKTLKFINTDRIKAKVIYFLIGKGAIYKEIHNKAIDKYFKSCNNGDMDSLKNIMTKDSYEHVESEIKGVCKLQNTQCIKKTLKSSYGATNYKTLYKKDNTFYIFITDIEPKIIALTQTKNGTISFGEK